MIPFNDDQPIDLRALNPDQRAHSELRFTDAVMTRVRTRGNFPAAIDPLFGLWLIARPILIAAAVASIAIVGSRALETRKRNQPPDTVAEATGVPPLFLASDGSRP